MMDLKTSYYISSGEDEEQTAKELITSDSNAPIGLCFTIEVQYERAI